VRDKIFAGASENARAGAACLNRFSRLLAGQPAEPLVPCCISGDGPPSGPAIIGTSAGARAQLGRNGILESESFSLNLGLLFASSIVRTPPRDEVRRHLPALALRPTNAKAVTFRGKVFKI
jgi:hypothetical protein